MQVLFDPELHAHVMIGLSKRHIFSYKINLLSPKLAFHSLQAVCSTQQAYLLTSTLQELSH